MKNILKIVFVAVALIAPLAASEPLALVNTSSGKVQTFVRPDVPEGWSAPEGYTAVPRSQLPEGWEMEAPPAPAVPESVTRRQLKEWLIANDLIDQVEAALNAIADAKQRRIALNWWTESQDFRRDHPLVASLAAALGMTSEQVDAAFSAAAQL